MLLHSSCTCCRFDQSASSGLPAIAPSCKRRATQRHHFYLYHQLRAHSRSRPILWTCFILAAARLPYEHGRECLATRQQVSCKCSNKMLRVEALGVPEIWQLAWVCDSERWCLESTVFRFSSRGASEVNRRWPLLLCWSRCQKSSICLQLRVPRLLSHGNLFQVS